MEFTTMAEQQAAGFQGKRLDCVMGAHAQCDGKVPGHSLGAKCWCSCHDDARPAYRPVSRPTPEEQDPRYREAMIDAGRGHLLP